MRLAQLLCKRWVAPANVQTAQTLTGKPIRNTELFELERIKWGNRLINDAKSRLRATANHASCWEALRRLPELTRYQITATNFENKFVDLIYETGLDNDPLLLRSLKEHFESRRIDQNPIQQCAYAHLLLMLSKLESNSQLVAQYAERIEQIYASLLQSGFLSKEVCVNFMLAYGRSSPQRFQRICNDMPLMKQGYVEGMRVPKRVQLMDIAFDMGAYDVYFALMRSFQFGDTIVLQQFRNHASRLTDEATYLRYLQNIYDSQVSLCTSDVARVNTALRKLGQYRPTQIKPTTGHCPNCGERMPTMSDGDLRRLRDYFLRFTMQHASMGKHENSDVLMKNYVEYLQQNENTLDLVIDGLNLGFQGNLNFALKPLDAAKGGIKLSTKGADLESNLIQLMNGLLECGRYPKMLFIGRFFQFNYERLNQLFVKHDIKVRYFQKHIEDDLPVILAALYNRNCRILTNDFYDDHHHEMKDPELKRLFPAFLNTRRVTVARSNNFLNYYNEGWLKRVHHNPKTHTIHVPFDSENLLFKRLFTWQCYTKS